MAKATLEDTGERLVPEYHKGHSLWGLIYAEHYTRYLVAKRLVKNKTVLDIACGSGYGAKLMSETAVKVYAIDSSIDAIKYAKKNYHSPRVEYIRGDATKIPLSDNSVDTIVSFETIEHIKDPSLFLKEIKRVMKADGLALISTPNKNEFAEGNHFHFHEYDHDELVDTLNTYFKNIKPYYQTTWKCVTISDKTLMGKEGEIDLPAINLSPLEKEKCLYFYFICSDREIKEKIDTVSALGGQYSDKQILSEKSTIKSELEHSLLRYEDIDNELQSIKSSRSYRLSKAISNAARMVRFWR